MAISINSDDVQVKHLLKADPFVQIVNVYNKSNGNRKKLVEDTDDFFTHIYGEAEGEITINNKQEKLNFDEWMSHNNNFDDELNSMLFFIEGYAGCGKSTLVQHILYTKLGNHNYEYNYYNYDIGTYLCDTGKIEGKNKDFICCSILYRLTEQMIRIYNKENGRDIFNIFKMLMNDRKSLEILDSKMEIGKKFGFSPALWTEVNALYENENVTKDTFLLEKTIIEHLEQLDIYQLLCIDYLWRLAQYLSNPVLYRKYMYVCYDNLDSITDLDVLYKFKINLIKFRMNLSNYISKLNDDIKLKRQTYKTDNIGPFIIFSTYRKITAIRTDSRHTEMLEDNYDEDYVKIIEVSKQYNFVKIAEKRIKHFTEKLKSSNICGENAYNLIKQMKYVKELKQMEFVKSKYAGLWNNNLRSCSNVLNDLIVYNNFDIKKCIYLFKEGFDGNISEKYCYYGASSLFLHAICKLLKKIEIFNENNLDLVNIKEDTKKKKTSFSRLVITYLYTKKCSVSIVDLFDRFDKVFEPRYICKIIGQLLTRVKGEIWRRPIYYSKNALNNESNIENELYNQYLKYKNNERYDYVEFKVCDCGETYIEAIVPHFEFYSIRIDETNRSLYCVEKSDELDNILKRVYEKMEICCEKQIEFAQNYMEKYNLNKREYLKLPFHPGTNSKKEQLHIEKVIFSHIAYFNNYRGYLFSRQKVKYDRFNVILIDYIKKYLNLYTVYITKISNNRKELVHEMEEKVKLSERSNKFISIESDDKSPKKR